MALVKDWAQAIKSMNTLDLRAKLGAINCLRDWRIYNNNYPELTQIILMIKGELSLRSHADDEEY